MNGGSASSAVFSIHTAGIPRFRMDARLRRQQLSHARVDDLAVAGQQRLARDLVCGVDRQRRLLRAVLPSRCVRNVMMFFEYIWLA